MNLKKKFQKKFFNWTILLIIIVCVILLNIISSFMSYKIDMTKDLRFSLANGTKSFLENKKNIESRIMIKIYLEGNLPAEIANFKNSIENKLKDFKSIVGNQIEYEFINPNEGSKETQNELFEQLFDGGKGIQPMEISYSKDGEQRKLMIWPGAKLSYSVNGINKSSYIQFLPGTKSRPYDLSQLGDILENAQVYLEYNLISSIRRLTLNEKKRIAFLHGHGELNLNQTLRARGLIAPYFSIDDITLNDSIGALDNLGGLIIADPQTPFSSKDLYIIDQFVMNGGKLMCFMNTLQIDEDSLKINGEKNTFRKNLKLENMLFDYGIKLNENYVKDAACVSKIISVGKDENPLLKWFFHVLASPSSHPITRNIEPVSLKYVNEITLMPKENSTLFPLLNSSSNSDRTGLAPFISFIQSYQMRKEYGDKVYEKLVENPEDKSNQLCLAALAEGYFESHFKNRIAEEFTNNPDSKYNSKSIKKGKVIVVGNGQFIANKYDSIQKRNSEEYAYFPNEEINDLKMDAELWRNGGPEAAKRGNGLFFGNQDFFQNIVDYMMGYNFALDIRSRQIDIKENDKEKIKLEGNFYKLINMTVPIVLILLLALFWIIIRKKKYIQRNQIKL